MHIKTTFIKFLLYFFLITILYLATTTKEIEIVQNSWDKLNHIFAFAILYVLLTLSFKRISFYYKIIVLILFGFSIEIIQYFIPERDFSIFDIFADIIGIMIGYLMTKFYLLIIKEKTF